MIEDIRELTKESPAVEGQKAEPAGTATDSRHGREKSELGDAEGSSRPCCYTKAEEESEEDVYDHHGPDHRGKNSYHRGAESNGRVLGSSASSSYYYGDSEYRHSSRADKHGSGIALPKHSSKNLAPAVVSSKRSKHRKQGMEQKISKFSPIEEAKDVESDLASYAVTTSVGSSNVASRAKKLQEEITYGLKKNVYEQQKYYGVSSRDLVDEEERVYSTGSRTRSSGYGVEKSSVRESGGRSKSYEREGMERSQKGGSKPSSLGMSQSRGRAPVRAQPSEEESPVSPLGKVVGGSRATGGSGPQSAGDPCSQFCSSHSLPDVQEHIKDVPRSHSYKHEEGYGMDDAHCVVSDSEAESGADGRIQTRSESATAAGESAHGTAPGSSSGVGFRQEVHFVLVRERHKVLSSVDEVVELYRELSRHPGLKAACLGPDVTTQYGGKYCSLHTEWSQRDLARAENIKFCRQYLIFHDGASIVYSGPAGTCSEMQDEVMFVVDTVTGATTSLTADAPQGSWSVLTIDRDILVARFSTPSCPHTLKVAVLPSAGLEAQVQWVCLQDAPPVPGISWGIRTLRPPPAQEHPQYGGLDFDAILLRPSEGPTAQKHPLVVMPHGGPHSVFTAGWMLYPAALCRVGFAVLLDHFGCLAWSHSETHLLYVAEKKRPKAESFFQSKAPELSASNEDACRPEKADVPLKGEQFVYHEDWGEALSKRSVPVLCVMDVEASSVSVLEGVPEHLCPGQAFWSPDDTGVVFVGWWPEPFRLGLQHCTNRRSALFYVDLTSGACEQLSDNNMAVWSPRLSPDRCRIVYLELGQFPDPYHACVVRNPVVNIASMVAATDIPDWCLTETGLPYVPGTLPDPAQWTEMLHKSPMRYIDQVRAPVLLMLGEDDRRVPPQQGLEYYRALKARGVPTRLLLYPGNNHALAGVEAEADGFMNMVLWLVKHLQWLQQDLERGEDIKFCRQYLIVHDGDSVVYSGPTRVPVPLARRLLMVTGLPYAPSTLLDPAQWTEMLHKSPMRYIDRGLEHYRVLKARGVPTQDDHTPPVVEVKANSFTNTVLWLVKHLRC
ncbi:PREDICTED: acylamino-acid-releasing enzyme [Charadrius vociferus]|uniref:acylamino-acid-releasing enzyme n=1 Tax=Charadrius vociferus TaxID=50402 RepID=UPI000521C9DC|nr:PREDICTED: acylamino-acid-releasing enzyme [Charadrius vociferus]